ncbi:MAG: 4Fe-4S binding protein [Desulfatibacillaceae bacterium]|nr:4Fe-4S binding protein [Desulfatibacillaceae bacterium]
MTAQSANKILRPIIEIDEEKCDGCGQCVMDCAEGALEIIDGKAKLVGEFLCDGLGACLGGCPTGALKVVERLAPAFDEHAVEAHLASQSKDSAPATLECGCPGSAQMSLAPKSGCPGTAAMSLNTKTGAKAQAAPSALSHWPIKLRLVRPDAPYLKGADILLLADCSATAYPALHSELLPGKVVLMGCPKFDDLEDYINRLAAILKGANAKSLTVAIMEVPCCRGFAHAAAKARELAGVNVPINLVQIARSGEILEQKAI